MPVQGRWRAPLFTQTKGTMSGLWARVQVVVRVAVGLRANKIMLMVKTTTFTTTSIAVQFALDIVRVHDRS